MDTKRLKTGTIDVKDITIGIELEMILFKLPFAIKHVPYGELEFIANALEGLTTEMGVMPIIEGLMIKELKNFKSQDTSIEGMAQRDHKELHFQIKDDISIKPFHPTNKSLHGRGVEVCTPILTQGNWEQTLRSMCTAITTACQQCGAAINFNDSCGLHVHIGLGREYTVRELKQLAKAIVLFERQMDQHHPRHRRPPPPNRNRSSMIASNLDNHGLTGLTPAQMIWRIDDQTDVYRLLCLINGANDDSHTGISRYYKYNLTCVLTYKTVEFRQAAGTIDAEWIVAWVENICSFVTAAAATGDETWYEWAESLDSVVTDAEIRRRFGMPDNVKADVESNAAVDEEEEDDEVEYEDEEDDTSVDYDDLFELFTIGGDDSDSE
ncbi:putative amidoligase enzyme-domain-containing protein [Morchella snyderi]|nr:putative amidoligase enzyme-domain-containing protein [Morchella snyderi]